MSEVKLEIFIERMRCVVQRVKNAKVEVEGEIVGEIGKGLLVLFAVHLDDTEDKIKKMSAKILDLRIFSDEEDKMNLSVRDIDGEILVVSQFTLYGDCRKGNRPSFIDSARPEKALPFYEEFVSYIKDKIGKIEEGKFGAAMEVSLVNDGPVTVIIDL